MGIGRSFHSLTARSAFTLTEIAIVIGIIGMILSGVWIAAGNVHRNYIAADMSKELQLFQLNMRTALSSATPINDNSCPTPCSTDEMTQLSLFPQDFINSNLISGAPYSGVMMHTNKYGYPIWTGIEPTDMYIQQDSQCGGASQPACSSAGLVVEVDMFNMPTSECISLLMNLVNNRVDGLVDITANSNGWGPIEGGAYWGNPTLPRSMDIGTASKACTSGDGTAGDGFGYVSSTTSFIWMWFNASN